MLFEATINDLHTKSLKVGKETRLLLIIDTSKTLVGDLSVLVNKRVYVRLHPEQYEVDLDLVNGKTVLTPATVETDDVGQQVAEAMSAPCAVCGHEESKHTPGEFCCIGDDGRCNCIEYVRPIRAAETIEILTGDGEVREMVTEVLDEGGPVPVARTIDDMVADVLAEGMVERFASL